jgi:hypothetical protein
MNKLSIGFAVTVLSVLGSCGDKDKDKGNGSQSLLPQNLVGADFKNTAKSPSDVTTKMKKVDEILESSSHSFSNSPDKKVRSGSGFTGFGSQVFGIEPGQAPGAEPVAPGELGGQASSTVDGFSKLQAGEDCSELYQQIGEMYGAAVQSLSAGMKQISDKKDESWGQGWSKRSNPNPNRAFTFDVKSDFDFSGVKGSVAGELSGAANDSLVLLEGSLSASAKANPKGEESLNGTIKGDFQTLANLDTATFSSSAGVSFAGNANNTQMSGNMKFTSSITGGKLPAVSFKVSLDTQGAEKDHNQKIAFEAGMKQTSENNMSLTLSTEHNGKISKANVNIERIRKSNNSFTCKVVQR